MKIVVTGAAGMLAAEVVPAFLQEQHEVIQTDINLRHSQIQILDVRGLDGVFRKIGNTRPDYVFHLAAETNVDLCEKDPDHAFEVNAIGTKNIVLACKEFNAGLLYISSGMVFDGRKPTPYTEFDTPSPINVYGKSKYEGELIVGSLLSQYFIIRAGWMVGGWELDKKFVYKIVQQLKQGKKKLIVVNDKFGSPTFTKDFTANLKNVIKTGKYGLYHMANKGTCSRYDIAIKIVEFMGLKGKVKINPVSSAQFPLPAPRPYSEMIDNYKLDSLGINNMPHWEDSLREYIRISENRES